MTTITASSTIGVVLSSPSYANPVVIDPGVVISNAGDAVFAGSGSWTVQNFGTIESSATSNSAGIALLGGGSVTNESTASITGGFWGVYDAGGPLIVVNDGTIASNTTTFGVGIVLEAGGTINNQSDGLITGGSGVYGVAVPATVVNAGVITANASTADGIRLNAGGYVSNASSGTISGFRGITGGASPPVGTVTVVNAGKIVGTNANSEGIHLWAGGAVTNLGSASITGATGIVISSTGSVTNDGSIAGASGAGISLTTGGYVDNQTAGSIYSAGTSGIFVTGAAGTLLNAGLIESATSLSLGGAAVQFNGGGYISNASGGTIGADALAGISAARAATVVNDGVVQSSSADAVEVTGTGTTSASGTVMNLAAGTISTDLGSDIYIGGFFGGAGTVINAGMIQDLGTNHPAISLYGGYVSNALTGTIGSGSDNIYVKSSNATVVNAGQLLSGAGTVVRLRAGGTVTNQSTGTISGAAGINDLGSGTITNAGLLRATGGEALSLGNGGAITNLATGTISSDNGIAVDVQLSRATIVNAGNILALDQRAVYLRAGGAFTNDLTGTITAGLYSGVYVAAYGTVTNLGTVNAGIWLRSGGLVTNQSSGHINSPNVAGGYGVGLYSGGTIVNAGQVTGLFVGIDASHGGGTVINQSGGSIAGPYVGVLMAIVDSPTGGHRSLTNQAGGTISGDSGFIAGANVATVDNAGLIVGTSDGTIVQSGITIVVGAGVSLKASGTIGNAFGGTISGVSYGINIIGAGTVDNAGLIVATGTTLSRAVMLQSGGYLSNAATGVISSSGNGNAVRVTTAAGTIFNAGTLIDNFVGRSGVALQAGGRVTNAAGGLIQGGAWNAIYGTGAGVTVVNAGILAGNGGGSSHYAIQLKSGGAVTNDAGGTITAPFETAIYIGGATGTVVNAGLISSGAQNGIQLADGGAVSNQSGGVLDVPGLAVRITGAAGTLVNAGAITGTSGAVAFSGGFGNRLVVDPGAAFGGTVDGGNTLGAATISTLELASGALAGTLTGLGTQFIDFADITIDSGATWLFSGANSLAAGATISNAGTLELTDATLTGGGVLVNDGEVTIDPSTMTLGSLIGAGSVTIGAGSTLAITGSIASTETIVFAGSGAYLYLGDPIDAHGSVTNFDSGETIDLKGISPASVSYASGQLTFGAGGSFPLAITSGQTLQVATSGDGTDLTTLCFCLGTLITTPRGEVPVERLKVGDRVTTLDGKARPVVWIGAGAVLATRGGRSAATPVIVRKGALADNVPHHDLRVTKGHSFYLDGVLIPVEFLVNHRSIEWDDRAQEVQLRHIELATHDILIANGAPAESYRDDGNRWLFHNANGGWGQPAKQPCAPVLTGGPMVDAVWRRLLERAGPRPGVPLTDDPALCLLVDGKRVECMSRHGMAYIFALPNRPTCVRVASRAAAPAELGLARDPRLLGVAIRRIALRQATRFRVMEALDPSLTEGFHTFEPDLGLRWTDGDASLPAGLFDGFDGPMELVLHVAATTQYPIVDDVAGRPAA